MKGTIEIQRWDNDEIIFSYTCENNNFSKNDRKTVKNNISLCRADLSYLDLNDVDLSNANLIDADFIDTDFDNADFTDINV